MKPRARAPTDLVRLGTWRGHLSSHFVRKVFGDIVVVVAIQVLLLTLRLLYYFNPGADVPRP